MKITKEQLFAIEMGLVLAEYFVQDQEQGTDLNKSDSEKLQRAMEALKQIQDQL